MKPGLSRLFTLASIFALIGLAFVGHRFSPLLLPKTDVGGVVETGCDLQQRACPATLADGGRVQLSIAPRPIPALQPLQVEVVTSGIEARKVEIDFAGANMNMGYNRTQLGATAPGRHAGEASLPVCVSGGMTWIATVLIETDRQRVALPFRFDSRR